MTHAIKMEHILLPTAAKEQFVNGVVAAYTEIIENNMNLYRINYCKDFFNLLNYCKEKKIIGKKNKNKKDSRLLVILLRRHKSEPKISP